MLMASKPLLCLQKTYFELATHHTENNSQTYLLEAFVSTQIGKTSSHKNSSIAQQLKKFSIRFVTYDK